MAMQQNKFWRDVKKARKEVSAALQTGKAAPNQPDYNPDLLIENEAGTASTDFNVVYITSLTHYDRGTTEGHVVECHVELAGQKIVEQTHRLSTEEEIDAFVKRNKNASSSIKRQEIERKMQFVQSVDDAAEKIKGRARAVALNQDEDLED